MTVLQLASIYQTIANNGVRVPPRIVASVTDPDGTVTVTPAAAPDPRRHAATAQTLRTMLESVTMPGGTGVKAAVPGYRVAGKTGTAQQPDPAHGGAYSEWMNWDTFAGMMPADDPQFVVAIMVDNPAHGPRAATSPLRSSTTSRATRSSTRTSRRPGRHRGMCHCRCAAGWTVATCPLTSADVPTPANPPAGVPRPATPRGAAGRPRRGPGDAGGADVAVTGITAATDLVRPGDLFAASPADRPMAPPSPRPRSRPARWPC